MISIPKSLEEIDISLISERQSPQNLKFDLSEITNQSDDFFLESSLTQWLLTILRNSKDAKVEILGQIEDELLSRLAVTMPGTLVALSTQGRLEHVSRKSSAMFKEKFFRNLNQWPNLDVSNATTIYCLDSYKDGLPQNLYNKYDQFISGDTFIGVLDKMKRAVATEDLIRGRINERKSNLAVILHELFDNTDSHARWNLDGTIIQDSIRAIHTKFYPIDRVHSKLSSLKRMNHVEQYAWNLLSPRRKQNTNDIYVADITGFLELSIFDSGPGFAATWLRDRFATASIAEQMHAVKECFNQGRSSTVSSGRGYGLSSVLTQLKKLEGFIRLRTNQVHAARSSLNPWVSEEIEGGGRRTKPIIYDWNKQYTETLSTYAPVQGSLVSVLLPLGDL